MEQPALSGVEAGHSILLLLSYVQATVRRMHDQDSIHDAALKRTLGFLDLFVRASRDAETPRQQPMSTGVHGHLCTYLPAATSRLSTVQPRLPHYLRELSRPLLGREENVCGRDKVSKTPVGAEGGWFVNAVKAVGRTQHSFFLRRRSNEALLLGSSRSNLPRPNAVSHPSIIYREGSAYPTGLINGVGLQRVV